MYVRNTPYKVLSNSDVRIRINDNNLSKLQRYQAQRQDSQGQKVSVNSIGSRVHFEHYELIST